MGKFDQRAAYQRQLTEEIDRLKAERGRYEREVKGMMPESFLVAYQSLVDTGMNIHTKGQALDDIGHGKVSSQFVTDAGGLKSEKAQEYRRVINRKLRKVGRDINAFIESDGEGKTELLALGNFKCAGCGRFTDKEFSFCPWCGANLNVLQEQYRKYTAQQKQRMREGRAEM